MEIVYKNPEIEYVELGSLPDGTLFKHSEYNHMYMKLYVSAGVVACYDLEANSIDRFITEAKVRPFRNAKIVVTTVEGA